MAELRFSFRRDKEKLINLSKKTVFLNLTSIPYNPYKIHLKCSAFRMMTFKTL